MKRTLIGAGLLFVSITANAAIVQVELVSHLLGHSPPSASAINPAPTFDGDSGNIPVPTYWYNEETGELSSSGISHFRTRTGTNPTSFGRHFDRYITDLNIVGGSAAGSAAYDCVDGGFSFAVGASFCGNYLWGPNGINDSSATYGPGLAFSRDIQGDDVANPAQQSINDYNLIVASYDGVSLVLESAAWTASGGTSGLQMNFAVVPVPAAFWLFGSALGLLALSRRTACASSGNAAVELP